MLAKLGMLTVDTAIGVGIILISPLLALLFIGWGVGFLAREAWEFGRGRQRW